MPSEIQPQKPYSQSNTTIFIPPSTTIFSFEIANHTISTGSQKSMSKQKINRCELCAGAARMYCESDGARLCFGCDAKVHGANFLVARHLRTLLCRICHGPTPWKAEGARLGPTLSLCRRCVDGKTIIKNPNSKKIGEEEDEEEEFEEEEESEEEDEGDEQVVPGSDEESSCFSSNERDGIKEDEMKSKRSRQNVLLDLLSNPQDQQPDSFIQTVNEDEDTLKLLRPLKLQKNSSMFLRST